MEDTQRKEQDIVAEWAEAEKAPEPSETLVKGAIKDSGLPEGAGMKFLPTASAGYVYVYHQRTGDRSRINRNMLGVQLSKRLEDGSPAFSTKPPTDRYGNIIEPIMGTIKCMLHKDDPNRELYDRWGLPVCPCDNLRSLHDLTQHMKYRHKREWATIEGDRQRIKDEEERDTRRATLEAMQALAGRGVKDELVGVTETVGTEEAPLYISEKDKKKK